MVAGDGAHVHVFSNALPQVRIHPFHVRRLGNMPQRCQVLFGLQSVEVPVLYDLAIPPTDVWMSSNLFQTMDLDAVQNTVRVSFDQGKLRVGPVIGILCNPAWNPKKAEFQKSRYLEALEKLVEAATEQGAVCFLFRMKDVDFLQSHIRGFIRADKGWKQVKMPFPDAVYDQVLSRRLEQKEAYRERHDKLIQMYGDRVFNHGFFDKWQVHQWLSEDPLLRGHVPKTVRYVKPQQAAQFISQHEVTFAKPIHGSLGLGIVRFTKCQDGAVSYEMKRGQNTMRGAGKSPAEAVTGMKKRLSSRPHILQEGISLAMYNDRPFDIRIVLQRDGKGAWKRTKMFARVAQAGGFTSNISSGGEALPVSKVLTEIYANERQVRHCERQIRKVSRMTAQVIEEQSRCTFGELGVDVGVDRDGGVWVIEVNSKPWKAPATVHGRQDIADMAFKRPMEYAIWLAQHK